MSKHTLGPWKIQRYVNYFGFGIYAGDRGCIAERWYDTAQDAPYGDEIAANARLIAAAPRMLEALERAPVPPHNYPPGVFEARFIEWYRDVRNAAIAQAKGGGA